MIVEELAKLTGQVPHHIINHLNRTKLDANRDIDRAALGVPAAERAWRDFHGFIEQAKEAITGRGIVFDIHGQSHQEGWIELGYLINKYKLESGEYSWNVTSIRNLLLENPDVSLETLLHGERGFGGILTDLGHNVVPSPRHPTPNLGGYYSGGYITRRYGSINGGIIDAIQIESPYRLRGPDVSPGYAANLSQAIVDFMDIYYAADTSSGLTIHPLVHANTMFCLLLMLLCIFFIQS